MTVSVGFIGVGNMGNPMAGNVLKAGFPLTVFDRHPPAMENLVQAGAQRAASAREILDRCEVVMTCLPASPDVEAAYLEPGGLVEGREAGHDADRSEQRPALHAPQDRAARQGAGRAFPRGARERGRERRSRGDPRGHGWW